MFAEARQRVSLLKNQGLLREALCSLINFREAPSSNTALIFIGACGSASSKGMTGISCVISVLWKETLAKLLGVNLVVMVRLSFGMASDGCGGILQLFASLPRYALFLALS
jgi:hypothetical protein